MKNGIALSDADGLPLAFQHASAIEEWQGDERGTYWHAPRSKRAIENLGVDRLGGGIRLPEGWL
jgi:hypothetical protein